MARYGRIRRCDGGAMRAMGRRNRGQAEVGIGSGGSREVKGQDGEGGAAGERAAGHGDGACRGDGRGRGRNRRPRRAGLRNRDRRSWRRATPGPPEAPSARLIARIRIVASRRIGSFRLPGRMSPIRMEMGCGRRPASRPAPDRRSRRACPRSRPRSAARPIPAPPGSRTGFPARWAA